MLGYFLDVCLILGSLQSFIKYLRLALVLCETAHYRKNLISVFQEFLARIQFGKKTGH